MAWSTPLTAVSNAALTAAQWNASVRDNLLETAVAKATQSGSYFTGTGVNTLAERVAASSSVSTTETTTSATYTDLTTPGPAVTATSGTRALVFTMAYLINNTVNANSYMSVEVSGSSTLAPNDAQAIAHTSATVGAQVACSAAMMFVLTAGSSVYTAKYRVSSGTGSFANRRMTVMPF